MGYKLGYHILVLPSQVLLINSVLTNEVLLYYVYHMLCFYLCSEMYMAAGELTEAANLMIDNGWIDQ